MANIPEEALLALAVKNKGGGGGGTTNYNDLSNQPQIGGVTLVGNKSASDLGLANDNTVQGILDGQSLDSFSDVETALAGKVDKVNGKGLSTNDYDDTEKGKNADNATAIAGILNGSTIDSFGDVETALSNKQDTLTFDDAPTENSNNPVKSGGIFTALAGKVNTENGKGLSTNDYSDTEKAQVATNASDISTLKSGLTTLDDEVNGDATTYPYADVITIDDAVPSNLADCNVKIEPVQDLHGYDKPWVGGAGKQELILTVSDIKTANTAGTWNGNAYTLNGITYTVNTDTDGNVISITVSGTSNSVSTLGFYTSALSGNNVLNGCSSGGGNSSYNITLKKTNNTGEYIGEDSGNGFSFTLSDTTVIYAYIRIASGYEISGALTFYPMIRDASITDDSFAPYTNICPISGHTEVVITDTKPNLYVEGTAQIKVATNWVTDNTVSASVATDLTVSGNTIIGTSSGYRWIHVPMHFEKGRTYHIKPTAQNRISNGIGSRVVGISDTYTPSETFDGFVDYGLNAGTYTGIKIGISTLDDYDVDDYNKKSPYYTIALGDTIYGGTVDFDSGVMTVTKAIVEYDGTENWQSGSSSGNNYRMALNVSGVVSTGDVPSISNELEYLNNYGRDEPHFYIYNRKIYVFLPASDETEFKSYLASNPLQVCYPLATPTTIQLTPQQIQLLKGQNTLTASTGQISVTVNGVSGSIGAVQEQVNDHEERIEALESGGGTVKELRYTGTGTTPNTIDFGNDTPKRIMCIIPDPDEEFLLSNYEAIGEISWGMMLTFSYWSTQSGGVPTTNNGGTNLIRMSFSGNTVTLDAGNAAQIANYSGQKYLVKYEV